MSFNLIIHKYQKPNKSECLTTVEDVTVLVTLLFKQRILNLLSKNLSSTLKPLMIFCVRPTSCYEFGLTCTTAYPFVANSQRNEQTALLSILLQPTAMMVGIKLSPNLFPSHYHPHSGQLWRFKQVSGI